MVELIIPLVGIAVLFSLSEWRWGFPLAIVTAILQDPLRKITPDKPVYFVVLVALVFGAACVGAWLARVPMTPKAIYGWQRRLALPVILLVLLIFAQAFHSYSNTGNPMVSLIGVLTYLAP